MQAWRDRKCADAPIERVAVAAGTDPDCSTTSSSGARRPSATYAQPADIVQAGWQPAEFFDAITPGGSDAILGITFTFCFVDDQGTADESTTSSRTSTATASSIQPWPRSTTIPRSSGPTAGRRKPSTSTRSSPTRPGTRWASRTSARCSSPRRTRPTASRSTTSSTRRRP